MTTDLSLTIGASLCLCAGLCLRLRVRRDKHKQGKYNLDKIDNSWNVSFFITITTYSENMFAESHFLSPDGQIQLMTRCIKQPAKLAVLQKKLVSKTFWLHHVFYVHKQKALLFNKEVKILFLMMFSDRKAHLLEFKRSESIFVTCFIFRSCQTFKERMLKFVPRNWDKKLINVKSHKSQKQGSPFYLKIWFES